MGSLLKIVIPHDPFNSLIKEGSAEKKMQAILAETKPEAAYLPLWVVYAQHSWS